MYRVDITADLDDEDEIGYCWTSLDEARESCRGHSAGRTRTYQLITIPFSPKPLP